VTFSVIGMMPAQEDEIQSKVAAFRKDRICIDFRSAVMGAYCYLDACPTKHNKLSGQSGAVGRASVSTVPHKVRDIRGLRSGLVMHQSMKWIGVRGAGRCGESAGMYGVHG